MRAAEDERFAAMYRDQWPRLVAELSLVTGSVAAAEECANEASTRLIGHWEKVSGYASPGAWVRRVGYNLAVDEHRRGRRLVTLLPEHDSPVELHDPRLRDAWERLARLTPQQRELIVRRAVHEESDQQIAADLGVPVGTVKSRLSRARAALRATCEEPTYAS